MDNSHLGRAEFVVSRGGIEPPTRRLRVSGFASASVQPVDFISVLADPCPHLTGVFAHVHQLGFHLGFQDRCACAGTEATQVYGAP